MMPIEMLRKASRTISVARYTATVTSMPVPTADAERFCTAIGNSNPMRTNSPPLSRKVVRVQKEVDCCRV